MEHSIGTGLIVGIVTASSLYVWNSESFTKPQKTALLICVIFPPAQWVGIIIMLLYNNYIESNSVEKVTERKVEQNTNTLNSQIRNLKDLKEKGILTEEEYNQKANKIESEKKEENLKNSQEYKQLKSLFDSGVLTKEEFILKTEILRKKIKEVVEISSESFYQTLESYKAVRIVKNKNKKYKVFIDKKQILNGAFEVKLATNYNEISAIKFKALDGEIIELYFIKILTKLIVEMKNENQIERGDSVYLKNGEPAKSGEYSNGFMSSKIVVENGKFVKYK